MSKKQLHILLTCCHNQGIPILVNIQIVSKESAKKYGLTARVINKLGFSISRMLAKMAVYREKQKNMRLKHTNRFNAYNREAEAYFWA